MRVLIVILKEGIGKIIIGSGINS